MSDMTRASLVLVVDVLHIAALVGVVVVVVGVWKGENIVGPRTTAVLMFIVMMRATGDVFRTLRDWLLS